MTRRLLFQAALDLYRAAYPFGPTVGSTSFATWMATANTHTREVALPPRLHGPVCPFVGQRAARAHHRACPPDRAADGDPDRGVGDAARR
jgi:hypothetical protein